MHQSSAARRLLAAAGVFVGFSSLPVAVSRAHVFADVTAPPPVSGTQNYTGSLGLEFDVGPGAITVTRLAVFDDDQDGLKNPITVGLYRRNDTTAPLIGLITVTDANSTLQDTYRFVDIPDTFLGAGFQGTIVASGYSDLEMNGNRNAGGPAMTFSMNNVAYVNNRFGNPNVYPALHK